ncbi:MAG: FliA/WhiG family RNA polymerase sigma factor [Desulfobacterales bacterium]|nr:FliA/WhiG family RNA polymerase sigma factor [Desulfobacterales bacterium]MCP4163329.1 FliA/WhiG family RNA polymerase sigma factor [Deltaproteobacteria bacterium]
MIVKYAYLVKFIAGRMISRLPSSVSFDELISAGSMGLIDAVDKFDAEKGVTLKTYAQFRIKGSILDELRSMDWYSRSMRKWITDIEKAMVRVENEKGSPATEEEVAEELDLTLEKYHDILSKIHRTALLRLDSFIGSDSDKGATFKDQLKSTDSPEDVVDRKELKKVLAEAIRKISEKEQIVISLYYYEELTLREIGEVLSLTESRICQIHTTALIKLKAKLKSYIEHL